MPSNSLVTLAASSLLAQGIGIPAVVGGTGTPLPDEVVLNPSEIAIIQDHVNVNNKSIRDICGAANIPVLDVQAILTELSTTGIHVGGITLTSSFLSGGAFSYDGVHPSDIGYAVLANEFIRVINASGGTLPPSTSGRCWACTSGERGRRASGRAATRRPASGCRSSSAWRRTRTC